MIEVRRADELGEGYRRAIGGIFVDAFYEYFSYFSTDRERLTDAFAHMLVPDLFYVGLVDGSPAGIAACTDGRRLSIQHDTRELRRHLGLVKGTIAGSVFKSNFQAPFHHPGPATASVECVATAAAYRGRGVASAILTHLLTLPGYRAYVLEDIADTNGAALRVYGRLGYTEIHRRPVKHTKRTGINSYICMRLERD
ncbi:GNAT family N-acetyltransferase [Allonocardiopsis opalescens]|uniref:Acetyltransferase (GNAT) family protein n=1 Tax=Allonocardiopsis opalescens TaxID=1144618 RepID=A0A2T0PYW7_9ACTN|nr:GNAT family N-acetyltransferase [Allonocardiopsis opalescens]PRX96733.1 acetyltransferase (GNAT) family protein [Allonocardiopsis opalescens]